MTVREARQYIRSEAFWRYALIVRAALQLDSLGRARDRFGYNGFHLGGFCGEAAHLLAQHLTTRGCPETYVACGAYKDDSHCWTLSAGLVIDATLTQFERAAPLVYIREKRVARGYLEEERETASNASALGIFLSKTHYKRVWRRIKTFERAEIGW